MLDKALKILKKLEDNGYEAYIVGGFVRDYILGIESIDIDITTNAKPMEIKSIFKDKCLPNEEYGSVRVVWHNTSFEVTSYRKDVKYINNRKPEEFYYVDSLEDDLKRRDFTINTLCMDSRGRIIDLMGGLKDINNRVIASVGDSEQKLKEDALRILRAVRFAAILNFRLKDDVRSAIINNKTCLNNISMMRKKQELDKIFSSNNVEYGITLLKELQLDKQLGIYNLDEVILSNDVMGIWASLDVSDEYPFTNTEKDIIKDIREAYDKDNLDDLILYKYGLYINSICASMKGIDRKKVIEKYEKLPITSTKDIDIKTEEIMDLLNREGGPYIKEIYKDLEERILLGQLNNDKKEIKEYIVINYM